ncbi:MAG TPA: 3-isopropylmalate dehydratase [Pirellulaceae bacterium]|nr:3-isopropylmalate dehydratase [Pirellulaceae bacterium]HMO94096.1 3-isopropylmalate dehydratase [Pirellulaceae bacterium]HMP71023.1 3-isopropylmalate dehydratase [Pirellulaceae bacterium]
MSRIWKFGSDVDTDQIVPGRYAPYMRPNEDVGTAAFIEAHPEFNRQAKPGDLILANNNFGCGSSREYAPLALKRRQIKAILATSFARIFYRNAINLGIPLFVVPGLYDQVDDGVEADLDVAAATLTVDGSRFELPQLPEFAQSIISAGGIVNYVREHGSFPGEKSRMAVPQ